jgi:exodeoxyribonuclease VII small subunit
MSDKKSADITKTFEAKMQELEAILAWFESDEMELHKSVEQFERGMKLAKELEKELAEAQNKVEVLKKKFAKETVE